MSVTYGDLTRSIMRSAAPGDPLISFVSRPVEERQCTSWR